MKNMLFLMPFLSLLIMSCGKDDITCVNASDKYSCSACKIELCRNSDNKCEWYQTSDGEKYDTGCPTEAAKGTQALSTAKVHCECK